MNHPPPEPKVHTLSNGLRVVVVEQNHLHSAGVGLYVSSGPRNETPESSGISHFLEHVLFRGNAEYPSPAEMNRAFEGWGGALNGYTSREYTSYFGRLHPSHLQDGLGFFSQFVGSPLFEGIELERSIIREEQLEDLDEDGQETDEDNLSREVIWGSHPLGMKIIGSPANVRGFSKTDLERFFKKHYCAANMVLVINGRCRAEMVLEWAEQSFSDLPGGEKAESEEAGWRSTPGRVVNVRHPDSQVEVLLCFDAPSRRDSQYHAMAILRRILDDGMSSRLWRTVVEDKGLCYELWAGWDAHSDVGVLDIGASVTAERLIPLLEEIYGQVDDIRRNGPGDEEFELAKKRWAFSREYALDRVEGLNDRLGRDVLMGLSPSFSEQWESLERVSKREVGTLAAEALVSERHLLVAVGPLGKGAKKTIRRMARSLT